MRTQTAAIKASIKYGMDLYDISVQELAATLRMSSSTLYSRLRKPDTFTVGELMKVSRKLHTTVTALLKVTDGQAI